MRIGLINELHGRPDADPPAPTWASIKERALRAERTGFDVFVYEDALLYRGAETTDGGWESMAISAALAEATSTIRFGQSVINAPYRSPAMVVSIAETINEISGGRYFLGIGAGNTADSDYRGFGFPTDHRFSRFAEAMEIIRELARNGTVTFDGTFHTVEESEIVLRGTDGTGPWIVVAGIGPKMLDLVAKCADAWNWWIYDQPIDGALDTLRGHVARVDQACHDLGRDPATLTRTIDLYSVLPAGVDPAAAGDRQPVTGSAAEIADYILRMGELGIAEVRIDVLPQSIESVEAVAEVVDLVHRG